MSKDRQKLFKKWSKLQKMGYNWKKMVQKLHFSGSLELISRFEMQIKRAKRYLKWTVSAPDRFVWNTVHWMKTRRTCFRKSHPWENSKFNFELSVESFRKIAWFFDIARFSTASHAQGQMELSNHSFVFPGSKFGKNCLNVCFWWWDRRENRTTEHFWFSAHHKAWQLKKIDFFEFLAFFGQFWR